MNSEYSVSENLSVNDQMYSHAPGRIKASSKILRQITLVLQVASILAYYLPSLISGGVVGVEWLAIGVVQTVIFCMVFFRDERTRTGISIALMVIGTLGNLVILVFISFFALIGLQMGLSFSFAFLYSLFSLIALIFALCFPRRYKKVIATTPYEISGAY